MKRFRVTTDSKHQLPIAENLLNRQFAPTAPNRVWVADITYIPTNEGWLFLAAIKDLYTCENCSQAYRALQVSYGMQTSMSRKGNCWDTQSKMALNACQM